VSTASRSAAFAGTAGSSRAMWPKMDRRWRLSVDAVRKLDSTVSYEKTGVCTVYGMVT